MEDLTAAPAEGQISDVLVDSGLVADDKGSDAEQFAAALERLYIVDGGETDVEQFVRNRPVVRNALTEAFFPGGGPLFVQPSTWTSQVDDENAQAHLPPSACIFVANLHQGQSERDLQSAVQAVFSVYGKVYVKIRRDPAGMPYAFCQFLTDLEATNAVNGGKGVKIHGRPCRTERARANRTLMLIYRDGTVMPLDDAKKLAPVFGNIDSIYEPSQNERDNSWASGNGIIVQFKFYDDGRDAILLLRDHPRLNFITKTLASTTTRPSAQSAHFNRLMVDRKSVFVGNLPQGTTEGHLQTIFHHCGTIQLITVHQSRSIRPDSEYNVFAFVEFTQPSAVLFAIEKDGVQLGGNKIRVNRKSSQRNGSRMAAFNPGQINSGSPPGSAPYGSPKSTLGSPSAAQFSEPPASAPVYYSNPFGFGHYRTAPFYQTGGFGGHPSISYGYNAPWTSHPVGPADNRMGFPTPTFPPSPPYFTAGNYYDHQMLAMGVQPNPLLMYPSPPQMYGQENTVNTTATPTRRPKTPAVVSSPSYD